LTVPGDGSKLELPFPLRRIPIMPHMPFTGSRVHDAAKITLWLSRMVAERKQLEKRLAAIYFIMPHLPQTGSSVLDAAKLTLWLSRMSAERQELERRLAAINDKLSPLERREVLAQAAKMQASKS
jgi:hypothetical protein